MGIVEHELEETFVRNYKEKWYTIRNMRDDKNTQRYKWEYLRLIYKKTMIKRVLVKK